MAGYELRVLATARATVSNPDRVDLLEAATDGSAIDHMHEYARTLPADTSVYLVPAGSDRSIASDSGSEGTL